MDSDNAETFTIFFGIVLALIIVRARCGHGGNILLKIPLGIVIFTKMLLSIFFTFCDRASCNYSW